MVDEVLDGPYCGTDSMTSISPHSGQPEVLMLDPSSQNAGQIPAPMGSFMRASMRPYWRFSTPSVFRRAEVQAPFVLMAEMTRLPLPSRTALGVAVLQGLTLEPAAQYTSSSLFPHPPPPLS